MGAKTSRIKAELGRNLWFLLLCVAVTFFIAAFMSSRAYNSSDTAAGRTGRLIDRRLDALTDFVSQATTQNPDEWMRLEGMPEDMVVYRYEDDTLRSWCNQFSTENDDISRKMLIERFTDTRNSLVSPLLGIDTTWSYLNIGPKWYIARNFPYSESGLVIAGLEIKNPLDETSINAVNPRLRLHESFALYPISYSGGTAVYVQGRPMLKIIGEGSSYMSLITDSLALWLSVLLLLAALLLFLMTHRRLLKLGISLIVALFVTAAMFWAGRGLHGNTSLFSPTIYAAGELWYSLGAWLLIGLFIYVLHCSLYICRSEILRPMLKHKWTRATYVAGIVILILGTVAYIHFSFKSLILNSNISLELNKISTLSQYTMYVYLSGILLLTTLPLLAQMLRPLIGRTLRYDVFSTKGKLVFSLMLAVYLMTMFVTMGFRREENRLEIWSNRMAVDRNLGFELQLRTIESAIAGDPLIPSLLSVSDDYRLILDRVSENYLSGIAQDYDVGLYMYKDSDAQQEVLNAFQERLRRASPVSDNSRMLYSRTASGRAQYTGMFVFYNAEKGITRLLLAIDSKADKENKGYSTIKGNASPGSVSIPAQYSFAKYLDDKLVSYRGNYAYPTMISDRFREAAGEGMGMMVADRRAHFISFVSGGEYIVISRPRGDAAKYALSWVLLVALGYAILSLYGLRLRRASGSLGKEYYKTRIHALIVLSLMTILVTMAVISVFFVYNRNRSNIMDMMIGKISTVQSLVGAGSRYFTSVEDFAGQDVASTLGNIGDYTKSDISLYTPSGRVFRSTAPEMFERMQLGYRLDQDAYESIVYDHKRYFIHRERLGGKAFYAMYAPVFNEAGEMLAIVCSPYTESALDLRTDALFYSIFIVTVFFILLLICRWLTGRAMDRMFGPLVVMGSKMNAARTEGMEYIIYEREDEVSSVVRAYNLMVHDLNESSKQMAQVERDKAWSEMARQVAHEIKNPLTPIKLQIQRIIRLRERNAPSWEEKFDAIVPVILSSIDTLTDTANEFSTFAKLYTEEPVLIDLDQLAKDETALFSEREDITIEYRGLQGAAIMGPKPQLTRVFVNLLTNAVQAIDSAREADGMPEQGQVILSIRNSTKEGFYDIVFEDNGPGVKDENRSHLFTPNFTTKSSGTGLGLAICKNILERCGGEIFYSKSFSLGGACFTCRLRRHVSNI